MTFNPPSNPMFAFQATDDCSQRTEIATTALVKKCGSRRTLRWSDEESNLNLFSVLCLLVPSTEMNEEEKNLVWYQQAESLCHKKLAKNVAKGIRNQDPSSVAESYINILSQVYKGCMTSRGPSEIAVAKLAQWTSVGHSRRGLEKWSVPKISKIRQQGRTSTIAAVLERQRMLRNNPTLQSNDKAESLRLLSLQASETSRHFARAMAKADEMALRKEPNIEMAKIRRDSARKSLLCNLNVEVAAAIVTSAA